MDDAVHDRYSGWYPRATDPAGHRHIDQFAAIPGREIGAGIVRGVGIKGRIDDRGRPAVQGAADAVVMIIPSNGVVSMVVGKDAVLDGGPPAQRTAVGGAVVREKCMIVIRVHRPAVGAAAQVIGVVVDKCHLG